MTPDLPARLTALRDAIALRARDCQLDPASITLVAVSKTYPADEVWPAIIRSPVRSKVRPQWSRL